MAFFNEDFITNHHGFLNPLFIDPMMESPAFANDLMYPMICPLFHNHFFFNPLSISMESKVVSMLRQGLLNCIQSDVNEVVENDEFDNFLNERFKGDEANESDDELDVCD